MRDYDDIQRAQLHGDLDAVGADVEATPPGYISGFQIAFDETKVIVGPGIANVRGRVVVNQLPVELSVNSIDGKSFRVGNKYQIYVTSTGRYFIDQIDPRFDGGLFGLYHPGLGYRWVGSFAVDNTGRLSERISHDSVTVDRLVVSGVKDIDPNAATVDDIPESIDINTEKDEIAQNLGYANYAAFDATSDTIIDQGYLRTGLIKSDALFSQDIVVGQQIRSETFTPDGNPYDPDTGQLVPLEDAKSGFHFSKSGKLKAVNADLFGSLRTGADAATDAKIAIADGSGITDGPNFSGTGTNDLEILAEGAIAGTWEVEISSVVSENVRIQQNNARTALRRIKHQDFEAIYYWEQARWEYRHRFIHYSDYPTKANDYWSDWNTNPNFTSSYSGLSMSVSDETTVGNFVSRTDVVDVMDYRYQWDYPNGSWTAYTKIPSSREITLNGTNASFTHSWTYQRASELAYEGDVYDYSQSFDVFKYRKDGGTWSSEITIPSSLTYAIPGSEITIAFGSRYGHTVGDSWTFTQASMRALSVKDNAGNEFFSASAGEVFYQGSPIIEEGSNSNGEWVKFASGLMICWRKADYSGSDSFTLVSFPIPFADNSYSVSVGDRRSSPTQLGLGWIKKTETTTSFELKGFYTDMTSGTWVHSGALGIHIMAIGRWK